VVQIDIQPEQMIAIVGIILGLGIMAAIAWAGYQMIGR